MGCMFGELNHVLVDMLVILHFECAKGAFGGLGQIGLPKVSVQLIDKLTPIIVNGQFWKCNQNRLPPQHCDVGEVRCCVRHSLSVSCKLMWPTIEGHDTANYERAQFRQVPTSELVRLSRFGDLIAVTIWTRVVLLVGWPRAWRVPDWIRLCGCRVVVGHRTPAARGITDVLRRCCWWGKQGCDWSGWHGKWCRGCWLFLQHRGQWPRLRCWPDWGVRRSLLGGDRRETMRGRRRIAMGQGRRPVGTQVLLLCLREHVCRVHQPAVPRGWSGVWGVDKGCRGCWGVGYQVGLPKRGQSLQVQRCAWRLQMGVDHPAQRLHKGAGCPMRGRCGQVPRGRLPRGQLVRC